MLAGLRYDFHLKKSSEFIGARCGLAELAEVCAPVWSSESNPINPCF